MGAIARAIVRWLTGTPRLLFGPTPMAELIILVDQQGRGHLFSSKTQDDQPETVMAVASAVIRMGIWYAEQRGLTIRDVATMVGDQEGHE